MSQHRLYRFGTQAVEVDGRVMLQMPLQTLEGLLPGEYEIIIASAGVRIRIDQNCYRCEKELTLPVNSAILSHPVSDMSVFQVGGALFADGEPQPLCDNCKMILFDDAMEEFRELRGD